MPEEKKVRHKSAGHPTEGADGLDTVGPLPKSQRMRERAYSLNEVSLRKESEKFKKDFDSMFSNLPQKGHTRTRRWSRPCKVPIGEYCRT